MSNLPRKKYGPASLKQLKYLQEEGVDLVLAGGARGSGKSYTTLLKILKYVDDPTARVLVVRETIPLLKLSGGLLDEASKIFPEFGGVFNAQTLKWKFPSGATVHFSSIPQRIDDWRGLQATHIFVDEADNITIDILLFLRSCLRSATYKGKRYLNLTFNPNPDSFLLQFVEFSLEGDFGIPRVGTEDVSRWWAFVGSKLYLGDSEEEVRSKIDLDGRLTVDTLISTYKFIPATIYDNPVLLKADPGYLANLENLPAVNRARFLLGAWKARVEGEGYFRREWCEVVSQGPTVCTARARGWDLAASLKTDAVPNPDWTAGVLITRDRFGIYYVEDVVRFRAMTDGVIKRIIDTAEQDGEACVQIVPRDPGQAGKVASSFFIRTLAEAGIYAKADPVSGHNTKLKSFLPLCSLAESGQLRIVKGEWNQEFFEELEGFTSDKQKQRLRKDDQVDAAASAFNHVCKSIQLPTFVLPDLSMASVVPRV